MKLFFASALIMLFVCLSLEGFITKDFSLIYKALTGFCLSLVWASYFER